MSPEQILLIIMLIVMVALFLTEKLPVDLTAISAVMLLTLTGYLTPDEAFGGFSSSAVITMIATFILGAALQKTGVADIMGSFISRIAGENESTTIAIVVLTGALLSSCMSNVAATALLLPAVMSVSSATGVASSRLLIPLCFGTILGGVLTVLGTTPNIIITDISTVRGAAEFGFFGFAPAGIAITAAGVLFFFLTGKWLLPITRRKIVSKRRARRNLASVYQLQERLFTVKVPEKSLLAGRSLRGLHFGEIMDCQVLSVQRDGRNMYAPSGDERLQGGDILLLRGRVENVKRLQKLKDAGTSVVPEGLFHKISQDIFSAAFSATGDQFRGKTLRDLDFRNRYGLLVVSIERAGEMLLRRIASISLEPDDIVHVVGTEDEIYRVKEEQKLLSIESDLEHSVFLKERTFMVNLPDHRIFRKVSLGETRLGELAGLTVIGLFREGAVLIGVSPEEKIEAGDSLIVVGEPAELHRISILGELEIEQAEVDSNLDSKDVGMAEVVLSPRSSLIDSSIANLGFRERYGCQVLALWRKGSPVRTGFVRSPLQFGDALLLQGERSRIRNLSGQSDFVVLSGGSRAVKNRRMVALAVMGLVITILLSVLNIQPVHVAACCGAVFVVLSGAVTMQEAYKEINWRIVILVGGLIAVGDAVENSGTAAILARSVLDSVGFLGPVAVMIAFSLLSSFISQILDGALAAVLLAPIAIQTAGKMGVAPEAFLVVTGVSASIAFLTPFSHKANLLVMAAGGYKARDYFRVGLPLTIVSFIVLWVAVPFFYGF